MRKVVAKDIDYGVCQRCSTLLEPVWFQEKEVKIFDNYPIETGRKRTACSHLVCPACFKKECVDETFDKPWI